MFKPQVKYCWQCKLPEFLSATQKLHRGDKFLHESLIKTNLQVFIESFVDTERCQLSGL